MPHRVIHVTGIVRPYVPGQWVDVRAFLGEQEPQARPAADQSLRPTHRYGRFDEKLVVPATGRVSVEIAHQRNASAGRLPLASALFQRALTERRVSKDQRVSTSS